MRIAVDPGFDDFVIYGVEDNLKPKKLKVHPDASFEDVVKRLLLACGAKASESGIVMPFNGKQQNAKNLLEVLFDRCQVAEACLVDVCIAAALESGRKTCCTWFLNDKTSSICCVINGEIIECSSRRKGSVPGGAIDKHLKSLLPEDVQAAAMEWFVALDYDAEVKYYSTPQARFQGLSFCANRTI